jgi:hypothetical protein
MKQIIFVLILIGHSIVYTFGQQKDNADQHPLFPDSKRYSLGFNTQFVLDSFFVQSTYTPLEIMGRMRAKTNQAFRARVKGMAWHTDPKGTDERVETHQSQFSIALGYEWHQPIVGRFGFYYGADLEKGWENDNRTYSYTRLDAHYGNISMTKPTVGLLPLAGFTYSPIPNLYISIETRLEIVLKSQKLKSNTFFAPVEDPDNIMVGSYGKYDQKSLIFNFQPYSGIFINLIL